MNAVGALHRLGVTIMPYLRLYGSDERTVFLQHVASGEAVVMEGIDTLVLCTGHTPVTDLGDSIEDLELDVHIIGDAAAPRTAEEAIYEGLQAAMAI